MEGNRKPCMYGQAGKRYFRPLMTAALTVTMVIGNIAASLSTAMAGQAIAKEEFRIHAEAIRAAAEKALKEGEPLTEPLTIGGKDKSLVKDYGKLLEANGTLYELDLFKDTETVKDVDGISLRVFMRLEEDDDAKSYALTGEEKLIFLYVNGSSETISARLNIDGYVSGFSTVRPYDAAFGNKEEEEAQSPGAAGTEEETPGTGETQGTPGGSGGSGSGSGGSSGGGSGSAGGAGTEEAAPDPDKADVTENADPTEGGTAGTGQTEGEREEETEETSPEETGQAPAEKEGEAETEEPEADESQPKKDDPTETREEAKNEENEGSGETQAPPEDKKEDTGNQAAAGTENKDSGEKDNSGKDGSQDNKDQKADAADNTGNAGDSGQADTGHESSGKDSGDTAKDSAQDDSKDSGKDSSVKDDSSDSKDSGAEKADDSKDSSAKDTGDSKDSGAKDAGDHKDSSTKDSGDSKDSSAKDDSSKDNSDSKDSGSKDTGSEAKDSSDSKDAGEGKEQAQAIGISLHEITRVAKGQASDSDADDENADSDYEEGGDPFDAEDAAKLAQEEQEKSFNRRGALSGKIYNLVSLEDSLTVRAFQTSLSKMGMDAGELAEGSHILTYNVNPVGSAVLVRTPELVRDEAEVTFGVIPQVGYHIKDVTANGESLEETGAESMASSSDAVKKALASSSDAGKGNEEFLEEDTRFYTIPSVLEDQEVEIWLTEEVEGSHPAFRQAQTINGVTVTVSAEEGILPEGTYLEVREVTAEFEEAVKEKLENEADENTPRKVSAVLAYDINLMLDGKKLSNHYWEGNTVNVTFSGKQIEETSKEADKIEILTLETPTELINAANGETEEIPASQNISIEDIEEKIEKTSTIETIGEEGLKEVTFDAEHFSVYVYAASAVGQTQSGNNTDPDKPFIRVQKDFGGFKDSTIFDQYRQKLIDNGFSIGISGANGKSAKVDLAGETYEEITAADEKKYYRFTWKITDLEAGTYEVSESGANIDGFSRTTTMNGENGDTCDIKTKKATMTFTGRQELPSNVSDQDVSEIPMYVIQGKTHFVVWTVEPLSANEREYFFNYINGEGSWGNLGQGSNKLNSTNTLFYHAGSTADGIIHYGGLTVTYQAPKVSFNASKEWTKAMGLKYTTTSAQGAEIEVINTYSPLPTEFKLVKKVEGSSVPAAGAKVSFQMYKYKGTDVPQGNPVYEDGDKTPEGYEVYNPEITTSNFSVSTDGYLSDPIVISGLEEGYYLLKEKEALAGYQKLGEYIRIQVSVSETDGTLICNVNESPSGSRLLWEWSSDPNDEKPVGTLTVINYPGVRLPDTGGPGVGLIKEFGWMLLILAMMMAGAEVRYYGDRRRKQRAEV